MWDRKSVLPDNDLDPAKESNVDRRFDGTNRHSIRALPD